MKSTLQSKISVAMWLMAAVCTFTAAITTAILWVGSYRDSVRQQMQAAASTLYASGITNFSEFKDFDKLDTFLEDSLQMEDRVDKLIRVYDSSRRLIFTTAGAAYDNLPDKLDATVKKPVFMEILGEKRKYDSIVIPYKGRYSQKTFYLQVAIPLTPYADMLANLWWQSIIMLAVLIGISIFLSHFLAKKLLKPVGDVAAHLEKLDPTHVEEWKPIDLGDQGVYLTAIVDGINLLAERTHSAITRLGKMARYVAHEMRTPLTIMQGEAETVLMLENASADECKKVLKSSLEEINRMSEIVTTVLQVGERAQVAPFFHTIAFDLKGWLIENKKEWERSLGRTIELDIAHGVSKKINADPKLLYRLVDNLVRNVKDHTPNDAKCIMTIGPEGVLYVRDNGRGLKGEMARSLNEKGSGSDAAGVGLSLCLRIAEISGIKLEFSNEPSGGLKVVLKF